MLKSNGPSHATTAYSQHEHVCNALRDLLERFAYFCCVTTEDSQRISLLLLQFLLVRELPLECVLRLWYRA